MRELTETVPISNRHRADVSPYTMRSPELLRQSLHAMRDERDQAIRECGETARERDVLAENMISRTQELHRLHRQLKSTQGLCTAFYLSGRICDECRTETMAP